MWLKERQGFHKAFCRSFVLGVAVEVDLCKLCKMLRIYSYVLFNRLKMSLLGADKVLG